MLLSVFYVVSFMALFTSVLLLPKNERRCSSMEWSIIALLTVFAIHTAQGVVLYVLLKMRITLVAMGILNFAIALACTALIVFVYKRTQKYYFDVLGWGFLAVLLVCTVVIGLRRFGGSLGYFRYATSDSAVHLFRVLTIVDTGTMRASRFFSYLVEALIIDVFAPFMQRVNYYRIYIASDLFMWFLSGAAFFAIIRTYITNKSKYIWGVIFTLLYFFGYPLNNLLYGFNYLGACVTVAGYVLYMSRCFEDGRMERWQAATGLCLGNLAAALCYTQFFPVIFGGSVLYMGASFAFGRKKADMRVVLSVFGFCAVVGIFGAMYILQDYGSLDVLFSNLEGEGPIYRDLWSNIYIYLLFVVIYVRKCIKNRKIEPGYMFLVLLIVYALFFFVRVSNDQTASYYFYKFHYLGGLYIIYTAYLGLMWSLKEYGGLYRIYGGILLCILLLMLTGVETRLHDANVWWVPQTKLDAYFDIYNWNKNAFDEGRADVTDEMQELYCAVAKLVAEEDCMVPFLGSMDDFWIKYYYNLTCQELYYEHVLSRLPFMEESVQDVTRLLDEYIYSWAGNVKYLMFEKDSVAYKYGSDVYGELSVVFENDYGIVFAKR